MTAHLPMLLTLTSLLLLTLGTVACAVAYAVAEGALGSRVRIDADVRIMPAISRVDYNQCVGRVHRVPARVTPPYSQRTARIMLNNAFDAMLIEVDQRIHAHTLSQRFQARRFAS